MVAQQVIRILAYRGVTVLLNGDRLIGTPRHLLDDELRRLISRFRTELIEYLQDEQRREVA